MKHNLKRIFCFLLAMLISLGTAPLSAFAYTSEQELLYLQMAEIGLIDENGEIIEENTFTLSDGRVLNSVAELRAVLASPDTELSQTVTVGSTGKSATLEQIAYALSLEYDMAEIADALNSVAKSSLGKSRLLLGALQPEDGGENHDVFIHFYIPDYEMNPETAWFTKEPVMYFSLTDSEQNLITLDEDVSFRAGLFCGSYPLDNLSIQSTVGRTYAAELPVNSYETVTIPKGTSTVDFSIDADTLGRWAFEILADGSEDMGMTFTLQCQSDNLPFISSFFSSDGYARNFSVCFRISDLGYNEKLTTKYVSANWSEYSGRISQSNWTSHARLLDASDESIPSEIRQKFSALKNSGGGWRKLYSMDFNYSYMPDADIAYDYDDGLLGVSDDADIDREDKNNLVGFPYAMSKFNRIINSWNIASKPVFTDWRGLDYGDNDLKLLVLLDKTDSNGNRIVAEINQENGYFSNTENYSEFILDTVPVSNFMSTPSFYIVTGPNDTGDSEDLRLTINGEWYLSDTTPPTVKSITVPGTNTQKFYPGQCVPVIVEFTEPVSGYYELVLADGSKIPDCEREAFNLGESSGNFYSSANIVASRRTFLYPVQKTDNTEIVVKGVRGVAADELYDGSEKATDYLGNDFENDVNLGYQELPDSIAPTGTITLAAGRIVSTLPEDSVSSVSVNAESNIYSPDARTGTVRVDLSAQSAFLTLWGNWATLKTMGEETDFEIYGVLDGDDENKIALSAKAEGTGTNQRFYLTGEFDLPTVFGTEKNHQIDIYVNREGKTLLVRGKYVEFTQSPVIKAPSDAFEICLSRGGDEFSADEAGGWPSGVAKTVFILDEEVPVFVPVENENADAYTYGGSDDFYWMSSNENVLAINEETGALALKSSGTAEISYVAKNGSDNTDDHTLAAPKVNITLFSGSQPGIIIPHNANTFFARRGQDFEISFSSNLSETDAEGDDITVELYEGKITDFDIAVPLDIGEYASVERTADTAVLPGSILTEISRGDTAAYTVRLLTTVTIGESILQKEAVGYIVVRSMPAVVTLQGLDTPRFVSGGELEIGWTVQNFDDENNAEFEFCIEKNGEVINGGKILSVGAPTGAEDEYSGSFTLPLAAPAAGLKEYYVVTAKAKNIADPTWSAASSTIAVYLDDSLNILVEGSDVEAVTLKNTVEGTVTTFNPSITNISGKNFSGLDNAQKIATLRSELGLLKSVSINFNEYDWSILDDTIAWKTSDAEELSRAVTINYKQGTLYEPLENFSYLYYLPQTLLMLCGLNDGTSRITATHAFLPELTDTIEVSVERLKGKLYLFQFSPAVRTNISYIDGKGVQKNLYSNSDGSLALYEPNGIASELRTAATNEFGTSYRGTFALSAIKSGEGNGVKGELYPLNALELRRAATAEFTITTPDGMPYANKNITLRGGVYRNLYLASNRDDAYCADAMFAKEAGESANLDGKSANTFTTDENGVLTVCMDLTQFTSKNNSDPVGIGDDLQFTFELLFENDEYFPALVTADGSLGPKDAMRAGSNRIMLESAGGNPEIFLAAQTIDYQTGRMIDARRSTGVIGPSANFDEILLHSTVMLWGENQSNIENGVYNSVLRTQKGYAEIDEQISESVKTSSYPFSSIPLIQNTATFNQSTFEDGIDGKKGNPLEILITGENKKQLCSLPLSFRLVNMLDIEKIEDSDALTTLMANIALYGSVDGANTSSTLVNKASDGIIDYAMGFLTEMGSEAGLVKAILSPTEDPTRYTGYFWTGMDTTKFEDLDYTEKGVHVEGKLGEIQVNDTFGVSDFKSMANGSYFEGDRSDLYGTLSSAIGIPIMMQLEGWLSTEIRYNFDKGEWEVLMTGGGFRAGAQLEYEKALNIKPMGIPLTFSIKLRGGITVDFQTAVRYSAELGEEWNSDTAKAINDYLTALRINAYFELFGGLGHDKGFTLKIGVFGIIEINNENRFLTRNYLRREDLSGQYLRVDGEVGLKVAFGVGPVVTEITIASIGAGQGWTFNDWDDINEYWDNTPSGIPGTEWSEPDRFIQSGGRSRSSDLNALSIVDKTTGIQSRDYLENERVWNGGATKPLMLRRIIAEAENDIMASLETNSYPYSAPMISDDGSLLVYLSDADSTDITDIEARFTKANPDGSFNNGSAIDDGTSSGFDGYGDSSLSFDGDSSFAGAAWLRQSVSTGLTAGATLNGSQQRMLMKGFEVMAAVWDGDEWKTTRLTNNGTQDIEPVIAVRRDESENSSAIAVWRSVQSGSESLYSLNEERVLYKIFDGTAWSEDTYTLYNGTAGKVKGISAKMLDDGTAAVAYTLDDERADDTETVEFESGCEIFYSLIDTGAQSGEMESGVKTIRATTNSYLDEQPKLTSTLMDGKDVFVLGWHRLQNTSGVESHDMGLTVFDNTGAPIANFPDALSDMVSTASFNGQFTFVRGAGDISSLSIIWNDAVTNGDEGDILRAIKFGEYDGAYGASAPVEVAKMPLRTDADCFDAYVSNINGTEIKAVIQGTTYSASEYDTVNYSFEDENGIERSGSIRVPKQTANLYTAIETYRDDFELSDVFVDFSTLAINSPTPVEFTIANKGINKITAATVSIDGVETEFENLNLLPGQYKKLAVVHNTGSRISNAALNVSVMFEGAYAPVQKEDTLYLDYPDIGISNLNVVSELEGNRTFTVTLYDQSPASLYKGDARRVVLGVYSDPDCTQPVNGKYFEGGADNTAYEIIYDTQAQLEQLDATGYIQPITFDIGEYISDAEDENGNTLTEVPASGVTLFIKARIENMEVGDWVTMPEADTLNNQKHHTFTGLLTRSGGAIATTSAKLTGNTVTVTVRNNSLSRSTSGNVIVTLLNEKGRMLESKQLYDGREESLLTLSPEQQSVLAPFSFGENGSGVLVSYGETLLDSDNTEISSITLSGTSLSTEDFDESGNATVTGVSRGACTLAIVPKNPKSTVTINGNVSDGGTNIMISSERTVVTIIVTAEDGVTQSVRRLTIDSPKKLSGEIHFEPKEQIAPNDLTPDISHNSGGEITTAADNRTVTITPDDGYEIESVVINGVALPLDSEKLKRLENSAAQYVFETADTGNSISVTFKPVGEASWENPFDDVKVGDWFYDAVKFANQNKLMNGISDDLFAPDGKITRAQFAQILYNLEGCPETTAASNFSDVKVGAWYEKAVSFAAQNGIVNGVGNDRFAPDENITREQLTLMLFRYCKYKNYDVSYGANTLDSFADRDKISDYAADALAWACGNSILSGRQDGSLDPSGTATRAESATIFMRLLKLMKTE